MNQRNKFTNCSSYDERNNKFSNQIFDSICGEFFIVIASIIVVLTFPVSLLFCLFIIKDNERLVVLRNGRSLDEKGPGVVMVLPYIDSCYLVDMRMISFDVPKQRILTKDVLSIVVDGAVFYRVINSIKAVNNVDNYHMATRMLAAATLTNVLGTKQFSEVVSGMKSIGLLMKGIMNQTTIKWGVKIERFEIINSKVSINLQRAMASEATSSIESKAQYIDSIGELNSSKTLVEAGKVLDKAPASVLMNCFIELQTISNSNRTNMIIIPVQKKFPKTD